MCGCGVGWGLVVWGWGLVVWGWGRMGGSRRLEKWKNVFIWL